MSYSNKYYEVMSLLGCGYSVQTICDKASLTYDELCNLAEEYNELKIELIKWFPRYDFMVKPKEKKEKTVKQTESDEVKEEENGEISTGKQSKQRSAKGKSK